MIWLKNATAPVPMTRANAKLSEESLSMEPELQC
jgi:hypothetical protein